MDTGHQSVACDLRYRMPWRGGQSPRTRLGRDYVESWVGLSMWKAVSASYSRCPTKLKACAVFIQLYEYFGHHHWQEHLATHIHCIIPCHLFGLLMSPLSLAQGYVGFYASLLGQPSLQEIAEAVYYSSQGAVHCFECFRGDPIETRWLPLFQLVNALLTLLNVMGLLIEVMRGFCLRRLRTE